MTAVRPREQGPSAFGEAFLQDPGLFPGRRSGETWGEREIAFELAGGAYVFSGLEPSQADALDGRFGSRVVGPGGSRVETLVFCVEARQFRELERGRPYTFDLDYSRASVRLAGPGFMARLDWTPDLRGALWTAAPGTSFGGAFENYFRVLLAYRLLDLGGALVHSAGVRDEAGGGYLLFGPSGAGKSTFARLAREAGASVLHDDLNPLCRGQGSTALKALPLSGDIGLGPGAAPPEAPLRALCRLRQSETDSLRPLHLSEALASLLACCPFVGRDPYRADQLLQNLESLVRGVPAYELSFALAGRSWTLLREAVQA